MREDAQAIDGGCRGPKDDGAKRHGSTTRRLGVVDFGMDAFVVADLPGLIEGAHAGVGLGHQFLRHVERTRVLVHLLDAAGEDPMRDYETIRREVELYDERMSQVILRPS